CYEKASTGDIGAWESTTGDWKLVPPARCHGCPARAAASLICGGRVGGSAKDQHRSACAPHLVARDTRRCRRTSPCPLSRRPGPASCWRRWPIKAEPSPFVVSRVVVGGAGL